MTRTSFRTLAVGIVLGAASMLLLGQTLEPPAPFRNQAIEKVFFPRRGEGQRIVGDGTILAPTRTEVEDLPPLVHKDETRTGRYQAVALGDKGEFLILDTQNGLARVFRENDRMTLHSARVPSHAIDMRVTRHVKLIE